MMLLTTRYNNYTYCSSSLTHTHNVKLFENLIIQSTRKVVHRMREVEGLTYDGDSSGCRLLHQSTGGVCSSYLCKIQGFKYHFFVISLLVLK